MSFSAYFFIYRPKRKHAENKAMQNTKMWEGTKKKKKQWKIGCGVTEEVEGK